MLIMAKKIYLLCLRNAETKQILSVLASYTTLKKAQNDLSKGYINVLPSDELFVADCSLY